MQKKHQAEETAKVLDLLATTTALARLVDPTTMATTPPGPQLPQLRHLRPQPQLHKLLSRTTTSLRPRRRKLSKPLALQLLLQLQLPPPHLLLLRLHRRRTPERLPSSIRYTASRSPCDQASDSLTPPLRTCRVVTPAHVEQFTQTVT